MCICFPISPFSLCLQVAEGGHLQGEVVALQSSLFRCQLELEANQRAQRQSQRMAEDLAHSRDRLHSDLEAALQHRETTEKYNKVGINIKAKALADREELWLSQKSSKQGSQYCGVLYRKLRSSMITAVFKPVCVFACVCVAGFAEHSAAAAFRATSEGSPAEGERGR